jgi:hypothetical protein
MTGKKFWAFACPYFGPRKAHIFVAQPPKNAPETAEELTQWIQSEELKKALGTPGRSNS